MQTMSDYQKAAEAAYQADRTRRNAEAIAKWDALTPAQKQAVHDEENGREASSCIRAEISSDDWNRRESNFIFGHLPDYADYSREHRSQD
jgi:hypothetical protein